MPNEENRGTRHREHSFLKRFYRDVFPRGFPLPIIVVPRSLSDYAGTSSPSFSPYARR